MEVGMVNSFYLESWGELIMAFWHFSTAKDMDLWLNWNCRTIWKAINIHTVMGSEEGVNTVCKATGYLVRVEASGQIVLFCWQEHFGLLFKDEQLMLVESFMDDLEIRLCELVEVDPMHCS